MKKTKGIILAGGSGTRLYPITIGTSKQLLPVYDKPMIYYPISVLMLAGIQEILVISTAKDITSYQKLLGNGNDIGLSFDYAIQKEPKGLAQAFMIGEDFIKNDNVALILGDNIFYGQHFSDQLIQVKKNQTGATIFGYQVKNPNQFGVVNFNKDRVILDIEEKPKEPKSNYAVTGLYFYDNDVIEIAKTLDFSPRGELEITDINKIYLNNNKLSLQLLGRGFAWLDTGTYDSLLEASSFVQTIERRQGLKIACLEEIALNQGWIDKSVIEKKIQDISNSKYTDYLKMILTD